METLEISEQSLNNTIDPFYDNNNVRVSYFDDSNRRDSYYTDKNGREIYNNNNHRDSYYDHKSHISHLLVKYNMNNNKWDFFSLKNNLRFSKNWSRLYLKMF